MDVVAFRNRLAAGFSTHGFKLSKAGDDWFRIFVTYKGVTIGRLSMEPIRHDRTQGHEIAAVKHYAKSDMPYKPGDEFFYLLDVWMAEGEIPDIDFDEFVKKAKQQKQQKIQAQMEWRRQHPKKPKLKIDSDGFIHHVERHRPKLSRDWMGEFRTLVGEAIDEWMRERRQAVMSEWFEPERRLLQSL